MLPVEVEAEATNRVGLQLRATAALVTPGFVATVTDDVSEHPTPSLMVTLYTPAIAVIALFIIGFLLDEANPLGPVQA